MSKQKMITLSALAALCLLASVSMHAKAAAQDGRKAEGRDEGMVVVRDAETGKMRTPTPEELRALRAKAPPSGAALLATPQQPRQLSRRDGARGVRLGEQSMVYEVVTRDADGKLSSQCVHGEDAARAAVNQPAQPAGANHQEHTHETR